MGSYIIRRLLLMIPTLFGITGIVFLMMAVSPGGIGGAAVRKMTAGGAVEPEKAKAAREYYEKRYGLNDPAIVQYGRWLNRISPIGWETIDTAEGIEHGAFGFKVPDLGKSIPKGRSVVDLYSEALPITLLLNLATLPLIYIVSVILGVYAARHRGKLFDVGTGTTLLGLYSVPVMWAGVLLIGFLANKSYLHWFPAGGLSSPNAGDMAFMPSWGEAGFERGWLLDRLWHLVLPCLCLMYANFAFLSKLMRASTLESLSADYVRTARAKGVDGQVVLWGHAVRTSLIPLITSAAFILPAMIGGSIIVEKIFSIQGMGLLTVDAIFDRDRELVMAGALTAGVLSIVGVLIADICYVLVDPRVSYD